MRSRARRRIIVFLALALGTLAVATGFFGRAPLERAYALHALRAATQLHLEAGQIDRIAGGYVVRDLVLWTRGGALLADAPLARVRFTGSELALDLERPRFVFSADRYRGDEPGAIRSVKLRVVNGSLVVTSGAVPTPRFTFDAVSGALEFAAARKPRYDVTLQLRAAEGAYPIDGRTSDGPGALSTAAWHAAQLPLATFAELLPSDVPLRLVAGRLLDVDVELGDSFRAGAYVDDARASLGEHALASLHGPLVATRGAIGSRGLAGTIDGVPLRVAGEVHDLPPDVAALTSGSHDLDELAKLLGAMANTRDLHAVQLEATAPGLAFGQYAYATENGPLAVSVVAVDPSEPSLHFDTALAEDHVVSSGERTSALGLRTGAIAGVNGDYFDIGRTYQPQGLLLRSGVLERGPTDRAALVIDREKRVTFAEFHLRGELRTAHGTMPITELNDWPPGNVVVITPAFGKTLPASPGRSFVTLEPLGSSSGRYRVTDVASMEQARAVRFGVAVGPLVRTPLPAVGETVAMRYDLEPHVPGAVTGIGGGPILLRGGTWYEDPHAPAPDERDVRWPVIALAKQRDGTLLMVALDGRHPERSIGATRPEFAAVLQRLGAVDAMALDSGGSVTLVARAVGDANLSVRNVPSDFSAERWVSDALFLYSSAATPSLVPPSAVHTPVPEARPTP